MLPTTSAVVASGPRPRIKRALALAAGPFVALSPGPATRAHPIGRSRLINGSTCLPRPASLARRTRLPAVNSAKLT